MKLGIAYNLFDGIELLEPSINSIRSQTDFIAVIYQTISNRMGQCAPYTEKVLQSLKERGLIDHLEIYTPRWDRPLTPAMVKSAECHQNEINKRILGQRICKDNGCTHFLSMDVDEFYIEKEFEKAKEKANFFDATAVHVIEYDTYPTGETKLMPLFCPFIHEIQLNYVLEGTYFVLADPTRRLSGYSKPFTFPPKEIMMHHMTDCRIDKKSLEDKFFNSSAKSTFKNIPHMIREILKKKEKYEKINKKDQFGIINYWQSSPFFRKPA